MAAAEKRGVDVQSPVSGRPLGNTSDLTLDDFLIDPGSETVTCCPRGCQPQSSVHDSQSGQTTTVMNSCDCAGCEFGAQCPVPRTAGKFVLHHTASDRRLAERRAEQATDAFADNYATRAGGESTNSGLKRRTGMGRLRTRGHPRMRMASLLRCAGWNILRVLAAIKERRKAERKASAGAFGAEIWAFSRRWIPLAATSRWFGASGRKNLVQWLSPSSPIAAQRCGCEGGVIL